VGEKEERHKSGDGVGTEGKEDEPPGVVHNGHHEIHDESRNVISINNGVEGRLRDDASCCDIQPIGQEEHRRRERARRDHTTQNGVEHVSNEVAGVVCVVLAEVSGDVTECAGANGHADSHTPQEKERERVNDTRGCVQIACDGGVHDDAADVQRRLSVRLLGEA